MGNTYNTIDLFGDEIVFNKLIEGSIKEFIDNKVTSCISGVFRGIENLEYVRLPTTTSAPSFRDARYLRYADFSNLSRIENLGFAYSGLDNLILRNSKEVPRLINVSAFSSTPISSGTGYIYVPRDLIESYKVASNWSSFSNQFRALEDYTVDGSIDGDFMYYMITTTAENVINTNTTTVITGLQSYTTTLIPRHSGVITNVTVIMGGLDVTEEVYNTQTNEVNIPIVTGNVYINATAERQANDTGYDIELYPYSGFEEGELTSYLLPVSAGTTLEITYYATKASVNYIYVYDSIGCGAGTHALYTYSTDIDKEVTKVITAQYDGYITLCSSATSVVHGGLPRGNKLYGKYLYVKIL